MKGKLTYLEAFKVMNCFLEKYYEQTSSEDIGSLLGGIQNQKRRSSPKFRVQQSAFRVPLTVE